MSETKVLTCPTCGAQLKVSGAEPQVKCDYCGNTVIVPDELRMKKPETIRVELPQPQVIVVPTPLVASVGTAAAATTAASGCSSLVGCLVTLIVIAVVTLPFLADDGIRAQLTQLFQGATGTGFAKQVLSFGGEGTGPGLFQSAQHVAVDGSGNVYISDLNTLRIQRFDASGKFVSLWTIEEQSDFAGKNGPSRIRADRSGNLYALYGRTILKYEGATGKLLGKISGEVVNTFLKWTEDFKDFTVLTNGNLLVISDFNNSDDLVRLDPNGKILSRVRKAVSTPKDDSVFVSSLHIAADGLGNIFVIDSFPSKPAVYHFNLDGKYRNKFGSKGDKPGQFEAFNEGIGVDGKSRIYVKDWSKLLVFDADGRYLDTIPADLYDNSLSDFAINDQNEIFVVGGKNKVYKLVVNETK